MIPNRLILLFAFMLPCLIQAQDKAAVGLSYLESHYAELGLTADDVKDVVITDNYPTKHNGFTHIYYAQTYEGVKVHKALFNVTINQQNEVIYSGNRFIPDFRSMLGSTDMNVSPEAAILSLTKELGYKKVKAPERIASKSSNQALLMYAETPYANGEITAEPYYYPVSDTEYKLVWEVFLAERSNSDSWYAYIDAKTGSFISKKQNTHYCKVHSGMFHNQDHATCNHDHDHTAHHNHTAASEEAAGDGSAYWVVALPSESPVHGPFVLASEPAIESSSPFGWHDEDGDNVADWTYTRGNNVWAYEDSGNNDASIGNEPDGGPNLQFDFQYDENANPADNMEPDVVGLFYMNNMMHDISYAVGFDERAGAFQNNNFGNGGLGNDLVFAEALDGSGTNNANFAPRPDGQNGQMQMYRWDFTPGLFRILDPNVIAGEYTTTYETGANGWNLVPIAADVDVTGEMVVVADNSPQNPQQGCGEIVNDVAGKIALIFRGSCDFGLKALNAEQAGAAAAIICNVPGAGNNPASDGETAMGMLAGDFGVNVTIPTMSMGYSDCLRIQSALESGPSNGQAKLITVTGPTERSSGFDNGVIAHEYGHGIYERLIGGPNTVNCTGGAGLWSQEIAVQMLEVLVAL